MAQFLGKETKGQEKLTAETVTMKILKQKGSRRKEPQSTKNAEVQ